MQRLGSWIIRVNTSDEDRQRRGQTLIILGIGLIALALASIPLSVIAGQPSALFISSSAFVLLVGVIILARAGLVNPGAYLLLLVLLAGIIGSIADRPATPNGLFFMILPILCASILLPPIHIWSTLVLALAGVLLGYGLLPANLRDDRYWRVAALSAPLLMGMTALVSFLGARMVTRSLAVANAARAEAEAANQALTASNASLEARVAERTAALQQLANEQTALAAQLRASLNTQKELNRVIAALSMPVIPVTGCSWRRLSAASTPNAPGYC